MTTKKYIPYAKQSVSEEDKQAVYDALGQNMITRGENVKLFEENVAAYTGALYAVAFCNATMALYAAFQAIDTKGYDRFITTPNSFIATSAGAILRGAIPRFYDIDRSTGNSDLEHVKTMVQEPFSRGKLILCPVHFAGIADDMQKMESFLRTPDSVIIEDGAHAFGSLYPDGSKVGSCTYSAMTVFSFHAIKNITTCEGGMITTNDKSLYEKLFTIRNSGMVRKKPELLGDEAPWYYEVQHMSGNFHMNEMQAALGISQLKRVEQFIEKRRELVQLYRRELDGVPFIQYIDEKYDARSAYHLFVVQIDFDKIGMTKTDLMLALQERGIGSQYHYIPLYRHPAVSSQGHYVHDDYPNMERYYKEALSLPLYYDLTKEDVIFVTKTIKELLRKTT